MDADTAHEQKTTNVDIQTDEVKPRLEVPAPEEAFYFDNAVMSPWANAWNVCGLPGLLHNGKESRDGALGTNDVFFVTRKICNAGTVESASPVKFVLIISECILRMYTNRDVVVQNISQWPSAEGVPNANRLFDIVFNGLLVMLRETTMNQTAFWTYGTDVHRREMIEDMRRSMLPVNDPDFRFPPHVRWNRNDLLCEMRIRQTQLRQMVQSVKNMKDLKREVHEVIKTWDDLCHPSKVEMFHNSAASRFS